MERIRTGEGKTVRFKSILRRDVEGQGKYGKHSDGQIMQTHLAARIADNKSQ